MNSNESCISSAELLWEGTLENRNISKDRWDHFCMNDDSQVPDLPDMERMITELNRNLNEKRGRLALYSHIDVDGILSEVIAYAGFTELGFDVSCIPEDKLCHDYKISGEFIHDIYSDGFPAIFISDINVTGNDLIDYSAAKQIGVKLLIADHHVPGKVPSDAFEDMVYVNPKRTDLPENERFPEEYRDICGAGVVWMILEAYAKKYAPEKLPQIDRLEVFAGIAAVADYVSLSYLSRKMVKDSISICRDEVYGDGLPDAVRTITGSDSYVAVFHALYFLLNILGRNCIFSRADINESFYRGVLNPVLNTFRENTYNITTNPYNDIFFTCQNPVPAIKKLLKDREDHRNYYDEVIKKLKSVSACDYIWFCNDHNDHNDPAPSSGILAQRKLNETGKPAIVLKFNSYSEHKDGMLYEFEGSLRSPDWIPLATAINTNGDFKGMIRCDGHENAAGVTLYLSWDQDEAHTQLTKLKDFLDTQVDDAAKRLCLNESASPDMSVILSTTDDGNDEILFRLNGKKESITGDAASILCDYADLMDNYAPFGKDFRAPSIELNFVKNKNCYITTFGSGVEKSHLRITIPRKSTDLEIVCYDQSNMADKIQEGSGMQISRATFNPQYLSHAKKSSRHNILLSGTLTVVFG